MLTEQSILPAVGVANKFSAVGKSVIPVPNTLLERLVSASYLKINNVSIVDTVLENCDGDGYSLLASTVANLTEGSDTKVSAHDTIIGDSLDQIATFVNQHISYARTEVKPMVMQFLKDLTNYVERNEVLTAESSINIKEYDIPEILSDESFIDGLKYIDGKALLSPDSTINGDVATHEQILSLMLTGDKAYDELIMPWATRLEGGVLEAIWGNFFTKKIEYKELVLNLSENALESLPVYFRIEVALVMYLISINLHNNPGTTSDGMTLSRYKYVLNQIKDYAAGVIWSALQRFALSAKNGTIVLNLDGTTKTAVVFSPAYNKWLDAGGKPETIIGILVSGRQIYLQSAIDANTTELDKAWTSYRTFYNASEINKRMDNFKIFMYTIFLRYISNPGEYATKYKEAHPSYVENANKLYSAFEDKLVLKDLDNLNAIALYVVGKIVFYFTDAYSILSSIERNCENNKNLDIREAALLSTIEYVTNYVMAQMTVS